LKDINRFDFRFLLLLPIAYFCVLEWSEYLNENEAKHWPSTAGWIMNIEEGANVNGRGISYSYMVSGRKLYGSRVAFSSKFLPKTFSPSDEALWIKERYPVNKEIVVFFDPLKPNTSVLLRRSSEADIKRLKEGALFLSYSFIVVLLYLVIAMKMRVNKI